MDIGRAVRSFLKTILFLCTLALRVAVGEAAYAHGGWHQHSATSGGAQNPETQASDQVVQPSKHVIVRAFTPSPQVENDCCDGDCLCHKDRLLGSCCTAVVMPNMPSGAAQIPERVERPFVAQQDVAAAYPPDVPVRPPIRPV